MRCVFLKKISAVMLIITTLIGTYNVINGDSYLDLEDKADILNELGIMKGDTTGYNLEGKLTRAQAATFIVRFIGRESEVLNNASYKNTNFADVPSNEWYAGYVGYCSERGIISGYSDGTFRPNDYVSEKSFLKLVLTSLLYEYGKDFDWGEVYQKAYEVGIVKDISYKTKTEDTLEFTRGDVVNILYEGLQTVPKGENKRVVQLFIDSLIISKNKAKEYGLILDEVETKIENIKAISANEIQITFNEIISSFIEDNIKVTNEDDEKLTIDEIKKVDDGLTYNVTFEEEQDMNENYKVVIGYVIDAYNNQSNIMYGTFVGYRPNELESELFMINKVEAVSNNIINVYFTQPVNNNALQSKYYTLTNIEDYSTPNIYMTITQLPKNNNGVSIYLENYKFTEAEEWELEIDGLLTSAYGVRLNQAKGDKLRFISSIEDNDPFILDDIEAINKYTLELTFNKQIDKDLAEQTQMYYLRDSYDEYIPINKATVDSNSGEKVYLYTDDKLYEDEEYKIMINLIQDITGQFIINKKDYTFELDIDEAEELEIEDVEVYDSNLIYVYFNKPLDEDTATDPNNYLIYRSTSSKEPKAVYYNKETDPLLVKIYLAEDDSMKENYEYKVKVLYGLKDEEGNELDKTLSYSFENKYGRHANVIIEKATIIGEDTIKIEFSQEIAKDFDNIDISNYKLTYYENGREFIKTPISINYYNPRILILKFDILDFDQEYTISFNKIINYGGISNEDTLGGTKVIVGK